MDVVHHLASDQATSPPQAGHPTSRAQIRLTPCQLRWTIRRLGAMAVPLARESLRIRLSSPADIAAAVPHIVGFPPEESLVVISLRGPRKRIGLTMRFDLPPASLHAVMADEVAIRLTGDKAEHAVIACCTTEASDGAQPPRADLIAMIRERLRDRDIAMLEALFIRDGRWWSYLCEDPDCCPPCGAEVPPSTDIAAAQALVGRALLPERQSL